MQDFSGERSSVLQCVATLINNGRFIYRYLGTLLHKLKRYEILDILQTSTCESQAAYMCVSRRMTVCLSITTKHGVLQGICLEEHEG